MLPVLKPRQLPIRVCLLLTLIALCSFRAFAIPATIDNQPANVSRCPGKSASFSVTATGALSYQWQVNEGSGFADLTGSAFYSGVTSATLAITNIPSGFDGYLFRCVVTAVDLTTVTSMDATLTVADLLVDATQTNVSCYGGDDGSASVSVSGGSGVYTYLWTETGNTDPVQDNIVKGTYHCQITDAGGCSITQQFEITEPLQLNVSIASLTHVTCFGESDGSAAVSVTGGTGLYTYAWDDPSGSTTASISNLIQGDYLVSVSDENGCGTSTMVTINEPTELVTSPSQVDVSCPGASDGEATVSVTGGSGTYTYDWWPSGGTDATASGLATGEYRVTITDVNTGCSKLEIFDITGPAGPDVTAVVTNINCPGGTDGTVTLNVTGPNAPYEYNWLGSGNTTAVETGLSAGDFEVEIKDASGCTITESFNVTAPDYITGSFTQTAATCFGAANGTATLTPAGGTPGYTYAWPGGQTTAAVTGLAPGSYTVEITDAKTCIGSATVLVTGAAALAITPTVTNATCSGFLDGEISLAVTGGTGDYTYAWASSSETGAIRSGLGAGNYSVTVTDENGCSISGNYTIAQPSALAVSRTSTPVSCFGGSNGTGTTVVTGGTAPYTYLWSNGQSSAVATNLPAGFYTVFVIDDQNCFIGTSLNVGGPAAALSATNTHVDATCGDSTPGSATVTATGGTGAYTYSWSPSGGTAATATNLAGGTYTCTITDANNCTTTSTVTITTIAAVTGTTSQTNVLCHGGSSGTATVTATGGTGPYTYNWSPSGGTSATATGLSAGTYTCAITSSDGCTGTASVTITEPAVISIAGTITNLTCFGMGDGALSLAVTGGSAPYTYVWASSSVTAPSRTGLAAGSYGVTVTDANGCTATGNYTVTQPALLNVSGSATAVSCFGGSNGTATAIVTGGTTPYSYSWSDGQTTAVATGLVKGSYTCFISDDNGCFNGVTVSVGGPAVALSATNSHVDATCGGSTPGSATVTATGGTGAYTYSWSPSGGTAATATNLAGGTYTCTITDANNCTTTSTVTIATIAAVTGTTSQTNVLCHGGSTGTATVTATGGTGPYTYSWSPAGGTSATATGLSAGTYTCTITSADGCTGTASVTITEPAVISIAGTITNLTCFGMGDGALSLAVTGGSAPYTYVWASSSVTAPSRTGLAAGSYGVTVTDANGCTATGNYTVTQPALLNVSGSATAVSCFGGSNGTATAIVTGGTTPYSYSWSDGQTTAVATGLVKGSYTCFISDDNGCFNGVTVSVGGPSALAVTTTQVNATCGGANPGSATVIASGGTAPYTYAWSPSGGTAATATGLAVGTYTCTITDNHGCSTTASVTITTSAVVTASSVQTNVSCNGGSNGSATVSAAGGSGVYTYSWSPSGGLSATATGLSAGTYTCTVTSTDGCSTTESVIITEPAALVATGAAINITCAGANNGSASVTVTGGTGPFSYAWSPGGETTSSINGLAPGTVTVTVTDANGCTTTANVVITSPVALSATISNTNVSCNSGTNGSATVTPAGGTGPYTYSWSPSGGTAATATGLAAGAYTVTVTDANGCTVTESITITQPSAIVLTGTKVDASCIGLADGSASVTATGGTGSYTYSWLPSGGTGSTATGLLSGSYTVTVTDANGCVATETYILGGAPLPAINPVAGEVLCNNSNSAGFLFSGSPIVPTEYRWVNTDASIGLPAIGTGDIAAFTATNNGTATITSTITVTPFANGCDGPAQSFTIVVKPTPHVTAIDDQEICVGTTTAAVNIGGPVSSTVYTWTNSLMDIGLAASGTGSIPAFTALNTTTGTLTATITVTPDFNNCAGPAETFNIVVNAPSTDPVSVTSSASALCGPGMVTLTVNGGSTGSNAQWKWYSGSCGGTLVGTGTTLANVPVSSTTTYYVRAEGTCNITDCASTTVTVNPKPVVQLTSAGYPALQPGMTTKLSVNHTPAASGDVFTWYRNGLPVAGLTSPAFDVTIDTRGAYTAKVTTALGCETTSNEIVIRDSVSTRLYVMPNPNNGNFKVRYYSPSIFYGKRHMTVYNARGELVYKKTFVVNDAYTVMDVNIMGVAQGVYIVIIGDANNRVLAKERLIVF